MQYYLDAFKKYAVRDGRATRKQMWMFVLFNILATFVISAVEAVLSLETPFLSSIYSLAILCPIICLYVRRLHDVNKCGWWLLLIFVPFANFYLLYLTFFKAGDPGVNNYGAPVGGSVSAEAPAYEAPEAPAVPLNNDFASYEMCPAPEKTEAKCGYCGAVLEEGGKFCSNCGAPVEK